MTRLIGPPESRRRRWTFLWCLVVALGVGGLFISGASGTLSGSSFDTSNHDLTDTSIHDWNPAGSPTGNVGPLQTITCPTLGSGSNCAVDLTGKNTDPATGNGDNAFGQGAKEDDVAPTIVFGSIPPNKDDLSRFYVNQEHTGSGTTAQDFLYLAWERTNLLGSAHMDFEFNKLQCTPTATPTNCSANGVTPVRQIGDVLFDFDFGGSGPVDLAVHKWITSANPGTDCETSSTSPCWSKATDLLTSGAAEGSVNGADVKDYNPPVPAGGFNTLSGTSKQSGQTTTVSSEFGEAGINLEGAGVFTAGTCTSFGSATLKSRSSGSSFNSELKDFIAPLPVNISNCGKIVIHKVTVPAGGTGFTYGTTGGLTPPTFTLDDGGTQTYNDVASGGYSVFENAKAGWKFTSLNCTATGTGTSVTRSTVTASITMAAGGLVDCTYTNTKNTATLATSVGAGPVTPGTAVTDTATVNGSNSAFNPSGNVTFFLCALATGACDDSDATTHHGTSLGTGALGNGSNGVSTATSPSVNGSGSELAPGRYCFRAEWPGDTNYVTGLLKEWGGTGGTGECFTVSKIDTGTVTTPNDGSAAHTPESTITLGSTIYDTAVVTGTAAGDPTGKVIFHVCTIASGTCTTGGALVGSATGVDLVSDGVAGTFTSSATSDGFTPLATGRYCFRGDYGGSTIYNTSSDSGENECFTVTDTTAMSSAQTWEPNDSATVTADHSAPLTGTLTIQLYTGATCLAANAVSGQVYTKTLTGATSAADRTLTTTNTSYIVSASATVSWKVTFTSGDSNVGSSSHCESTQLTVTN